MNVQISHRSYQKDVRRAKRTRWRNSSRQRAKEERDGVIGGGATRMVMSCLRHRTRPMLQFSRRLGHVNASLCRHHRCELLTVVNDYLGFNITTKLWITGISYLIYIGVENRLTKVERCPTNGSSCLCIVRMRKAASCSSWLP